MNGIERKPSKTNPKNLSEFYCEKNWHSDTFFDYFLNRHKSILLSNTLNVMSFEVPALISVCREKTTRKTRTINLKWIFTWIDRNQNGKCWKWLVAKFQPNAWENQNISISSVMLTIWHCGSLYQILPLTLSTFLAICQQMQICGHGPNTEHNWNNSMKN